MYEFKYAPKIVNPELKKQNQAKRAIRLKAARKKGRHTRHEWAALVRVLGGICVRCSKALPIQKDHIVPIYQGGSDSIDNLQPLCLRCNYSKGPEDVDHRPRDWSKRLRRELRACKS